MKSEDISRERDIPRVHQVAPSSLEQSTAKALFASASAPKPCSRQQHPVDATRHSNIPSGTVSLNGTPSAARHHDGSQDRRYAITTRGRYFTTASTGNCGPESRALSIALYHTASNFSVICARRPCPGLRLLETPTRTSERRLRVMRCRGQSSRRLACPNLFGRHALQAAKRCCSSSHSSPSTNRYVTRHLNFTYQGITLS